MQSAAGAGSGGTVAAGTTPSGAPKRICCVCKDTKKVRDECMLLKGEEQCGPEIEKHKVCLRSEGFDIH
jgi:cytochrome c oxidase assembly protein subunit 17